MNGVLDAIHKGGPVMVPIAAASVVAWWLALACRRDVAALGAPGAAGTAEVRTRLRLLATLVAVLPLLGLLGTVEGLIVAFDVIQEFGNGEPRMLAGGIRHALITTEAGLVAAIPLLVLHRHLSGRLERFVRHARGTPRGDAAIQQGSVDSAARMVDGQWSMPAAERGRAKTIDHHPLTIATEPRVAAGESAAGREDSEGS